MKKIIVLLGIIFSAMLFSGCDIKKSDANTIIKINNVPITKSDYEKAFNKVAETSALTQIGIDIKKDPNSYIHLLLKQRVINELIFKNLLEQEIKARKIKVTKEDIDKKYEIIINNIGSKEQFNELLKQNNLSQSTLKKDLEEQIKVEKLVDTLGVVNITDKDAQKYYKENIKLFKYPDKVKSSQILISADPIEIRDIILAKPENKKLSSEELEKKLQEEIKAKETKAREILIKLKKDPTQFAQLAKENSDDVYSASEGGNLGFLSKEEMPKEYANIVFAQKPNTISDLIVTQYGFKIIMVTDRMKAGVEPFDKVKEEIKNYLEMSKKSELLGKLMETVKRQAKIEYIDNSFNPEEIDKSLKAAQQKNPSLQEALSANE